MGTAPTEVKGTQHHFTRNGRLVANKQLVYKIHQDMGIASVSYKVHSLKALLSQLSIRRAQVTTLYKMEHKYHVLVKLNARNIILQ